jgi:tRNA dimethylallyltransferase
MIAGRLIVLSGPTASGKSALALALAREFPLEIVNADSLQVYRRFDIGTAKPTAAERGEVPHHLIDVAEPDEPYDAGRYVRDAERAIGEIRARGRHPMLVGGSGMYIRALLRGLDPLPSDARVRDEIARRWDAEGGAALHAELARIDPETSAKVHPSDRVRVLRALEIAAVTGIPPSRGRAAWSSGEARHGCLFLALWPDRDALYGRIDARTEEMFRRGAARRGVRPLPQADDGPRVPPRGGAPPGRRPAFRNDRCGETGHPPVRQAPGDLALLGAGSRPNRPRRCVPPPAGRRQNVLVLTVIPHKI